LAELLVSEPDVRLAIINAVLRDVATKSDIEKLREEMARMRAEYATKEDVKALRSEVEEVKRGLAEVRERIAKLEGVVSQLVERISDLDKRIDYVAKISWTLTAGVIATLIANIVMIYLTRFIR